ncbi:hypothetical protein GCK72_006714 [Caenorhabditis remanei]|uniref:Uncharacterized protein n=1 Tax=Caenorhabditis remanei TaxID=31234 RepID=A0A6A5HJ93_CAERE|nr:hypothetical protein GCK72_006714 [Caenorhabditis remanei]KAF1766756.1 hypothetical protein GCK72_006714 [Caenorhabditis remanei]
MQAETSNELYLERLRAIEEKIMKMKEHTKETDLQRLVQAEEIEDLKKKVINQEWRDGIFRKEIEKMKSDAQKQQESQVETAGIRAEPAFREAFKEIQKQVKTFGESVVEEIHLIRGKLEAVEKEQDNQREMIQAIRENNNPPRTDYSRFIQMAPNPLMQIVQDAYPGLFNSRNSCITVGELDKRCGAIQGTINGIYQMVYSIKSELDAMVYKQTKLANGLCQFKEELHDISQNRTVSSVSSHCNEDDITKTIVGEWKLISEKNCEQFCTKNTNYSHEVHSDNIKFDLEGFRLNSYFFNGQIYTFFTSKMRGEPSATRTRWYIVDNSIVSVNVDQKTQLVEYCKHSVKGDNLMLINHMSGIECTRTYKRIQ